jgi:H+/Cl- antiporter ClcA
MTDTPAAASPAAPANPLELIKSKAYVRGLIFAAILGVPISALAYGFLALVDWLQKYFFTYLPSDLGFTSVPWWWPLPLVALGGLLVALTIKYLPGNAGHSPSEGFKTGGGPTLPIEIPGVFFAALATLAFGAVLGPEAPLIALGSGLGYFAVTKLAKGATPQAATLIATAGSFAAISTLLGSPLLGAFLLMEAAGLGGAMLTVALLPGLLAAGVGSLVFTGLDNLTGLGTFSLAIPNLPTFTTPTGAMFGWAIVLGLLAPLLGWFIYALARIVRPIVHANRIVVTTVFGLLIAGIAVGFAEITNKGIDTVLFSGQAALPSLITNAATWSVGALALLIVAKSLAYALSLSAFRGGPVFPGMFIGGAVGVLASHLPGMSLVPAVGIGIGAMCATMLRLPFTSVLLATLLLTSDGLAIMPLVIVAVVISYVVSIWIPQPPGSLSLGARFAVKEPDTVATTA